ncbi:MAG: TRAP transporter small permease subunit [Bacteriovoracaceae bacterium]|nr:TRAP transporter small permease subunit [Bacteriovoracaceae bacterium]
MLIKILTAMDKGLERFCYLTLLVFMGGIILLSSITIFLRWEGLAFLWIDPLVRHLVFACAFLGGTLAVGRREHIGIDIIPKILQRKDQKKYKKRLRQTLDFISFGILIWLVVASFHLVKVEAKNGEFVMLGLHSSILIAIMPLGFSFMAYRYFYHFVASIQGKQK